MFNFGEKRAAVEAEGVFIGGWSVKKTIAPKRVNGQIESSQDRAQHVSAIQDWDAAEERALVRKLDLRVLLPCCVVYFFAYLDRANMGFAAVLQAETEDNIEESLHLRGIEFNWAVSITYFMVTALLLPSNLLMKKFSGKRYFPCIMVAFGTVVSCISAAKNAAGILTARFFLGIPESGVVPASIMYFSFWYKPSERAWRIGVFHAANSLASGVGGFLAIGVDTLNGKGGLESWRWLFIIEGAMPIVMAVPVYFLLLTFPETSTALTDRERHIAINRFGRGATRQTDVTWSWPAFLQVMSRPSTYVFFFSYICLLIVAVSLGTFLPVILKNFAGFSSHQSNAYTSAIYFVTIAEYLIWSWHSDWTRERMWHYLLPAAAAIPCFGVWNTSGVIKTLWASSQSLCNLVSISQPAALAYRSSTLYGASEQAVGGATVVAALSIASIIGPHIYPIPDKPWYLAGFSAACATLVCTLIGYASLPFWLQWEASRRKRKYGHAMPLRAMEDAQHAKVSEAARAQEMEQAMMEEKGTGDVETARHVEQAN